jgi:multiple sugar transport system ATP-binding protein
MGARCACRHKGHLKRDGVVGTIIFEDVTKVFKDGTVAVRSLNLRIEEGQFFVFLGPSGCGKTTLLRTVAGLEHPTTGRIHIAGRDVTDASPKERNVAMVFQNYSLYPHMTVYKNIAFALESKRLNKAEVERRVTRAAEILQIEDLLKRRPRSLSGGQQQRVAMGRAIVREPEAFLMDEPLSNLDPRTRLQVRAEIARIQRELGVTTLYVTHDQNEAMVLGDRVGILRDGVLQQDASPSRLYRTPENLFVAGFVGSPPMNLAEATVEEADDGLFVRFGGHRLRTNGAVGTPPVRLRDFAWRQVVVGVRPEDLYDASGEGVPEDSRLRLQVERREVVGPDVFLYFTVDAPLLLAEDPREAAIRDHDKEYWPPERANQWMARLGSAGASEGHFVELAVRPGRLYLFDPRTGDVV